MLGTRALHIEPRVHSHGGGGGHHRSIADRRGRPQTDRDAQPSRSPLRARQQLQQFSNGLPHFVSDLTMHT